jgi:hypothetical protein
MASYRLLAPYIRWGSTLQNAWYLPFPLDNVSSGSEPRQGSEFVQAPSGVEDAWLVGTDYLLQADARWLPQADVVGPYARATGWDGTLGIRAFLESWAQAKQQFELTSDGRNLLKKPGLDFAAYLDNAKYWNSAVDAGITGGSVTFDAGESAYKLVGTNPTGGALNVYMYQYIPSLPGEQLSASVSYKAGVLAGGAKGQAKLEDWTSAPAFIDTPAIVDNLTTTGVYTRVSSGFGTPAVTNTAFQRFVLTLFLPAGASGTIWFKSAMVRRDSTDSTFVDNYGIPSYWVDPMNGVPAVENEGLRRLTFKIRSNSAISAHAYDGY